MSLFAGTSSGVFALNGANSRLVGLPRQLISHLAANSDKLCAAVPVRGPIHGMTSLPGDDQARDLASGLHVATLSPQQEPRWEHVWEGDARSCAVSESAHHLYVGTEPADVFHSADGGKSWHGSHGFQDMPSRASWNFPAPPHQPHVLSIEVLKASAGRHDAVGVLAGVEVGGALLSRDFGGSWEERNNGLYVDVHSCRIDPHNLRRWFAVAGENWEKLMDQLPRWYTIGLALNPEREGEVLVTAGDRPPSLGVHVVHSSDGGDTWRDISDEIYQGEVAEAKGRFAPTPYFFQGQALLGCDTGHVLRCAEPGRRRWEVLCRLPHRVTCFAAQGQSPSSTMH
ncbi:hypothetical protein N2152v2_010883 [Parachlorella kessleri]